MDDLERFTQLLGNPLAIFAAIGLALWRFSTWLRPLLEMLAKRHVEFLDTTATMQTTTQKMVEQNLQGNQEIQRKLDTIHQKVQQCPVK